MTKAEKAKKWIQNRENKIPGRGYRTPVAIPLSFPYELERDYDKNLVACAWSDEYGGIYLGESKFEKKTEFGKIKNIRRGSVAFVKPHPLGLIYIKQKLNGKKEIKKTIIPGEFGLAKTLDILTAGEYTIIPLKNIDMSLIKYKIEENELQAHKNAAKNIYKIGSRSILKDIAKTTRKREIAAALLANGVWQKRGFVDKEKITPKGFWHTVPREELCLGDRRSMKNWWLDALMRESRKIDPGKVYIAMNGYKEDFEEYQIKNPDKDISEIRNKVKKDIIQDIKNQTKLPACERKLQGLREREALLKPLKEAVKKEYLPKYPWEIRGWDKVEFADLKKSYLVGLHTVPEWSNYAKIGAPLVSELHFVFAHVLQKDYLEELSPGDKKLASQFMTYQIENKLTEAHALIEQFYEQIRPKKIEKKIFAFKKTGSKDNNKKSLQTYVVPKFSPPEGWEWDTTKKSELYKNIRNKKLNEKVSGIAICLKNENGTKKEILFVYSKFKDEKMNAIEIRNLGYNKWMPILYNNADSKDVRTMEIFQRTLSAMNICMDEMHVAEIKIHPTLQRQIVKSENVSISEKYLENYTGVAR